MCTYPAALAVFMNEKTYREMFDVEEGYFSGYFSNEKLTDIDEKLIATVVRDQHFSIRRLYLGILAVIRDTIDHDFFISYICFIDQGSYQVFLCILVLLMFGMMMSPLLKHYQDETRIRNLVKKRKCGSLTAFFLLDFERSRLINRSGDIRSIE